ncbi:DUF6297 family protein [Rhodococcus rhodnii]|nr:DUF6297 family protein [Rhodococcus rhodnii]
MRTATATVPTAAELRRMRRRFAREHAPRRDLGAALVDGTLGTALVAGIGWWLVTRSSGALTDTAVLPGFRPDPLWAWLVVAGAAGAGLWAARSFGPLVVSGERHVWVLSTPVDRAASLRPTVLALALCGAVAGGVAGRLAAFVGAVEPWWPVTVFSALLGVAVVSFAALVQSRAVPTVAVGIAYGLGAVAVGTLAVASAVGLPLTAAERQPVVVVAALAGGMLVGALAACGGASRADLDRGAAIAVAARVSLVGLAPTILTGVVEENAWRRIARRTSRTLPLGSARALVYIDVLRHRRRPRSFVWVAVIVGMTWLAAALVSPLVLAWVQLVAVFAASSLFGAGLRAARGSGALLGVSDGAIARPLLVLPVCASLAVTAATASLTGWAVSLVCLLGAVLAAYRSGTGTPPAYDGLVLETGFGQLPVDLLRQKLRGVGVLAVAAAVVTLIA